MARSTEFLYDGVEPASPVPDYMVWSVDYSRRGNTVSRMVTWIDRDGNKDGDIAMFHVDSGYLHPQSVRNQDND